MTSTPLPHRLERTVLIQAARGTIFRYFTLSDRWAAWWGEGSTIDPTPGGRVYIRHPGGIEIVGKVVEVVAPERLVFTYGFASGRPIPPGGSLVTLRLEAKGAATRLHLVQEFADQPARDEHVQGWRYQLSVFANVVTDEVYARADMSIDDWFAAWSEPDLTARDALLARMVEPDIRFQDRFSLIDGLSDLGQHLAATHRFMPGLRMTRDGDVRHCQGTCLASWVVHGADGRERGRGTNVFVFCGAGRLASVTGFWERTNGANDK